MVDYIKSHLSTVKHFTITLVVEGSWSAGSPGIDGHYLHAALPVNVTDLFSGLNCFTHHPKINHPSPKTPADTSTCSKPPGASSLLSLFAQKRATLPTIRGSHFSKEATSINQNIQATLLFPKNTRVLWNSRTVRR